MMVRRVTTSGRAGGLRPPVVSHRNPRWVRTGGLTPPARPGLSIIEVLVSLAILLMSLVAIGQLVDFGSDRALNARMHVRGTRLAQTKLAEVEAGAIPIDGGGSGTFDEDPDWSWAVESSAQGAPNVYTVTVRVSRVVKGRPHEVALSQILYDPLKMGSSAQASKPQTTDATGATTGAAGSTTTSGGTSP